MVESPTHLLEVVEVHGLRIKRIRINIFGHRADMEDQPVT